MKRRIFIAINLPENVKKKLVDYQGNWPDLPVRWIKKENLHITLIFLGYLTDEELLEVCNITKDAAAQNSSFSINLNKIIYGPPKKPPSSMNLKDSSLRSSSSSIKSWTPRMVWAEGDKSTELGKLQSDLENVLLASSVKGSESENRPYSPHITLGRIRMWEFRRIEPEERPEVNEEVNLSFEVNSIEVMESQLKRGGAEYSVLESCSLKGQ